MFNVYKPGMATAGTLLPRMIGGLTRIIESFPVDKAIPSKEKVGWKLRCGQMNSDW